MQAAMQIAASPVPLMAPPTAESPNRPPTSICRFIVPLGAITYAPNVPAFVEAPVAQLVRAALDMPVMNRLSGSSFSMPMTEL